MPWDECQGTSPMTSQHWFRWWLGAVRQQAITWANVDLVPCRHKASPGYSELRNEMYVVLNSLATGKFESKFRYVIFTWISVIDDWGIPCEIALIWMSLDFTDDQSTLAWCRQATSHYLGQCWPRSFSPYGVNRPQWVNSSRPSETYIIYIIYIICQ